MPYVPESYRNELDSIICQLADLVNMSDKKEGVANYVITRLLMRGLQPNTYAGFNAAIGVLECVKLELYRRAIAKYENTAKVTNGDIPEYR